MKFDPRTLLMELNVRFNCLIFRIRKFLFGFENANAMLRRLDKRSMIPILRQHGARIGERCDIEAPLLFHNCGNGRFDNLTIGDDCHVGKNCFIDLYDRIVLENNVIVAMQTTFITHIHVGKSELAQFYPPSSERIVVHSHVYLSVNSTLLKGVEIGDHALVAAGGVVNRKVDPYTVVGGAPARFIKKIAQTTIREPTG